MTTYKIGAEEANKLVRERLADLRSRFDSDRSWLAMYWKEVRGEFRPRVYFESYLWPAVKELWEILVVTLMTPLIVMVIGCVFVVCLFRLAIHPIWVGLEIAYMVTRMRLNRNKIARRIDQLERQLGAMLDSQAERDAKTGE